jgi:hypothetical protein
VKWNEEQIRISQYTCAKNKVQLPLLQHLETITGSPLVCIHQNHFLYIFIHVYMYVCILSL